MNIIVIYMNIYCVFFFFVCLCCLVDKDVAVFEEAEESELMFKEVNSDVEAYELYNDYAFRKGFSVRKSKVRRSKNNDLSMRKFLCSNAGLKDEKRKRTRAFEKLNIRSGCKAFVQFHISEDGVYRVIKHNMVHNHPMIPADKRHLLRSQRKVNKDQKQFISNLKSSGVQVSDAIRVLRNEAGGSPNVGFTPRDVYNALAGEKCTRAEGQDCKQLIKYFAQKQATETDFYYEFEVDENDGSLVSFFWRDGRMKRDYQCFGDLLVFDTTYRTNRYGMICAPFVGMNHHCCNVMFGMGFILNEQTKSFVWLFECFLRSVGGGHPVTIMTDQCAAMAAAISVIFPSSNHRLCTWHLGENSRKNIGALRALDGFCELFNYLLKYVETVAEFEHFWLK